MQEQGIWQPHWLPWSCMRAVPPCWPCSPQSFMATLELLVHNLRQNWQVLLNRKRFFMWFFPDTLFAWVYTAPWRITVQPALTQWGAGWNGGWCWASLLDILTTPACLLVTLGSENHIRPHPTLLLCPCCLRPLNQHYVTPQGLRFAGGEGLKIWEHWRDWAYRGGILHSLYTKDH